MLTVAPCFSSSPTNGGETPRNCARERQRPKVADTSTRASSPRARKPETEGAALLFGLATAPPRANEAPNTLCVWHRQLGNHFMQVLPGRPFCGPRQRMQ